MRGRYGATRTQDLVAHCTRSKAALVSGRLRSRRRSASEPRGRRAAPTSRSEHLGGALISCILYGLFATSIRSPCPSDSLSKSCLESERVKRYVAPRPPRAHGECPAGGFVGGGEAGDGALEW